jgi:nucleotide-binding universal stress UspA family protein
VPSVPTILLALDQLASGETKIPVAIEYARMMGARLVLLHVLPTNDLDPRMVRPTEASARTYLDTVAAQVQAAGIAVAKVIRRGSPARAIVDQANTLDARLIILGANVHSRLSTAMVGSVADEVMRLAGCPVLMVQPTTPIRAKLDAIRSFTNDAARAGALTRRHLGLRTIEIARIVGSVCRARELGPDFRRRGLPRPGSIEDQRYQGILSATRDGVTLPAIVVYQIGFGYYVEDGHHRVAAARQTGQTEIEAEVTEFVPVDDNQSSQLFAARTSFEQMTGLVDLGATRAESYAILLRTIEQFAHDEGLADVRHAARRWEAQVYRPLWASIRTHQLSAAFPGDRTADTVARIAEVRESSGVDWEQARATITSLARPGGPRGDAAEHHAVPASTSLLLPQRVVLETTRQDGADDARQSAD